MQDHLLPDNFLQGPVAPGAVHLFHYKSQQNSAKNRVLLTTHIFSFPTEGRKEVVMGGERTQILPDAFVLMNAGNCFMSENTAESGRYASTLLFFDNALLTAFHLAHRARIASVLQAAAQLPGHVLRFTHDAFTRAFVAALACLPPQSEALLQLKLQEILLYLLETQPAALCGIFAVRPNNDEDLAFKNLIDRHIDSNLSVTELAFLCNVSLSTFKRKFAKLYQDSPTNWIRQKRMELAAFLLEYQHERPSDIYQRLGYENLSSFTQTFKNAYGKPPKEFQMERMR